jgi:hypothetical protein
MDFVAHYIFFGLYGLVICLNDLYGVFSGFISFRIEICYIFSKFRNRREKIYRNMWYITFKFRKIFEL